MIKVFVKCSTIVPEGVQSGTFFNSLVELSFKKDQNFQSIPRLYLEFTYLDFEKLCLCRLSER